MTDIDPQDDQDLEGVLNPGLREELKQARKDRRELARLQAQLETERYERLYADAGVPDTGPGKYFRKGYEGPMEKEAIRQAAISDGIIAASAEDAGLDDELARQRRMAQGVREGGEQQPDPTEALLADIRGATKPEDVIARLQQAQRDGVPGIRMRVQGGD